MKLNESVVKASIISSVRLVKRTSKNQSLWGSSCLCGEKSRKATSNRENHVILGKLVFHFASKCAKLMRDGRSCVGRDI